MNLYWISQNELWVRQKDLTYTKLTDLPGQRYDLHSTLTKTLVASTAVSVVSPKRFSSEAFERNILLVMAFALFEVGVRKVQRVVRLCL